MDDNKYKTFSLILEDENNKHNDFGIFINNLQNIYNIDYYAIMHDNDITEEGEKKRNHYHCVVKLKDTKTRKQTFLNNVSKCYSSDRGMDAIGCEPCQLKSMVRYLTHIDYENKAQYSIDLIRTNNKRMLEKFYSDSEELEDLTAKELIDLVEKNKYSKRDLLLDVGLNNYCRYAKAIDMLYNQREEEITRIYEDIVYKNQREIDNIQKERENDRKVLNSVLTKAQIEKLKKSGFISCLVENKKEE